MPTPFRKIAHLTAQQAQRLIQKHTILSKHVAVALTVLCFSNLVLSQEIAPHTFPDPAQLEAQAKQIVLHSKNAGHVSKEVRISITSGTNLFYPLRFSTGNNTFQTGFVRNRSHAELNAQGCRVTLNHTEIQTLAKTLQEAVPKWSTASIIDLVSKHEIAHCEDSLSSLDSDSLAKATVASVAKIMQWDESEQKRRVVSFASRLKQDSWLRGRMQEQYADLSAWILSAKSWSKDDTGVDYLFGMAVWQGWRYQTNPIDSTHDTSHSLALLRKAEPNTLAQLSAEEAKNAALVLSGLAAIEPDFKTLDTTEIQSVFQPASSRFSLSDKVETPKDSQKL